MNRVLVIGASGHVGRHVVAQLAAADVPVRALTRDRGMQNFPSQVEVARGDLTNPDTLDAPLDGIDSVFLVWTAPHAAFSPALERIAKRARRLVYLSAPFHTPHPFFQQPHPARELGIQRDRLIESSPLEWTILRPGMFAGNANFWWTPQLRAGNTVRWPYLDAPTAPIVERDIAAVAVRALCEEGHSGADYVLTGPESLTQSEQLSLIGRATGRTLQIEEISPDEARRECFALWPPPVVTMLCDAWAAAIGQPAWITSTVEEITGSPPRAFRDWATDHAPEFGECASPHVPDPRGPQSSVG